MNKDNIIDIEDLTPDAHNFNRGTDEGRQLMQRSLTELGAGRSILVDRNGNVIAGNKTQEAAIKAGIRKVRVIETDGTELVAVKRTDIDIDSAKGRELALVDNLATQVNLAWDEAELEAMDVEGFDPGQWGWEPPEMMGEPTDETEEEAIERKRQEFERKMAEGELDENDPEYQEFVKKFEAKRTTDDCYTPEVIYEAVADWVANEYNVSRANFVRPFYPGGDYQKEKYKPTDIVVDNPPFSILAEIVRFYNGRGRRFFLFAPSVTCLHYATEKGVTAICVGAAVIYANGAVVSTSFLTNLDNPEIVARTSPSLHNAIKVANDKAQEGLHRSMPSYSYPDHIFTAAMGNRYSKYGQDFRVIRSQSEQISELESQKAAGKSIYGCGLILSDKLAAEKAEAEKAAAEKAAATRWEISPREREIIERLNQATK